MKKEKMSKNDKVKMIAVIAVFTALALALDWVAGLYSSPFWSKGGSISIAMVPIFIMGYHYGLLGGLVTGFLVGTIQILWGYVLGFGQVCLDYILPYTVLGLVGIFSNTVLSSKGVKQALYIIIPILIVCIIRTLSHVLSGIIYFETPFWASLAYNGPFMAISTPLCIILVIILINRLKFIIKEEK